MSNFSFLKQEFPILHSLGTSAENYVYNDPNTTLFKCRLFAEKVVDIIYQYNQLEFPYDNRFVSKLIDLNDEGYLPYNINSLLHSIRKTGNLAAHDLEGETQMAISTTLSIFKVGKWLYESYSNDKIIDTSSIKFHKPEKVDLKADLQVMETKYAALEEKFNSIMQERLTAPLDDKIASKVKERSYQAAKKVELNEAETRKLIDDQLRQAGWEVDTPNINYKLKGTLPAKGKAVAIAEWKVGTKWADYALFIDQKLYGIIEAKKYDHDISTDLNHAKIYAELAEEKNQAHLLGEWNGLKVPFLFSTNGRPYLEQIKTKSGIWFLDTRNGYNRSKSLKGWYSPEGMKLLLDQDINQANQKLNDKDIDFLKDQSGLGLRDYQVEAISEVEKVVTQQPDKNRMLLAMATGTGKTRTIIGLCYRLIQSNRFKRILFLVDRRLLAIQAMGSFKDNKLEDLNTFSEIYQVQELTDLIPDKDTRLHFATVQSMVKRLFYSDDDKTILPVDAYDCIIVDEAHRGYLLDKEMDSEELNFKDQNDYVSKYRKVIDYFDATVIGLTATPALHTTQIFGKPIYTYSYREAVIDGYLIDHEPPYQIKTKLSENGIVWKEGEKPQAYDKENNQVIDLDEWEAELSIDIEGSKKMVITESFNRTVIKQLVQEIDPDGEEKTLVFAVTDEHADRVVQYFKEEYEALGVEVNDDCIKKITGASYNPNELVRRYKNEKFPNIAVTVDLLTTGIDVPSISNLVFMRRVKSRILYEQMLGRATRLCPDINKEAFKIYDTVRLYEALEDYTQMKPISPNPSASFKQLVGEMEMIIDEDRIRKQVEQIIAKIQRKKQYISPVKEEQFQHITGGKGVEELVNELKEGLHNDPRNSVKTQNSDLWHYLDELKPPPKFQLVSNHKDESRDMERGYGKGQKPADYLSGFEQFIKENMTKIEALNLICSRPKELDRKSLKSLYLELDKEGYDIRSLNTAWNEVKNETIAADIITFIRSLALGDSMISHEDRIKQAVQKVRDMKSWNKIQLKWLDRFEDQLIHENILQKEDFNNNPFRLDGGFTRLNKIFENDLETVIEVINENLYSA